MPARWNDLFDRNLMDAIREFGRWQDRTLIMEEDGVLLVSGGTEFPIGFSNCVARTDPDTDPALVIERAEEFFRAQGRGFTVWVRDHVDADIEAYLQQRGARSTGQSPWMLLTKRPLPTVVPEGAEVRITSDAADLEVIHSIIIEAFGQTGTPREEADSLFAHPRRVFSPVTRFALATIDGEPAATAMALLTGGMGGIYWVGTRPKFARRGLGTACTVAVANAAFELGKPMVGLHSTPMGQAVYERLGFERTRANGHRWYVLT
jgi:ribosomal protein S18 acetylase RimI-like enzyme